MASALALEQSELVIGRYRPLRPLGSGGSGSVWLARDEQTGLDVALKIVAREGKAAARAEREAAAAARLRHPSCLRAYAFARDPRHVYIAYEYVPGRTFRELLRAGELKDAHAIEACAQICDALAHAHAAGILHRDVKPSNVLIGESGRAKLLDFGLARMAEAETLTAQGDVPGTLAYIAPERLAGDDATGASDVWAVGVMLWESLVGRHPFWQTSLLDTARAIEDGAPPLATLRPDLPDPLLELVDRALERNPARRPTAAQLAASLRGAAAPRRQAKRRKQGVALERPDSGRAAAAGLAGVVAGWTAAALPFFPSGWPAGLGVLAAGASLVDERAGLAVALAVPVLPLGNVSEGLALVYAALAAAWLALWWRAPRQALLFAVGPALAFAAALPLAPLAFLRVRSAAHRVALAASAVVTAAVVAGLAHRGLPLAGGRALGIGVAGATGPLDVAGSLAHAFTAHAAVVRGTVLLAVLAALLPVARARGHWGAALAGAGLMVALAVALPGVPVWEIAASAWTTAGILLLSTLNLRPSG